MTRLVFIERPQGLLPGSWGEGRGGTAPYCACSTVTVSFRVAPGKHCPPPLCLIPSTAMPHVTSSGQPQATLYHPGAPMRGTPWIGGCTCYGNFW